MFWNIKNSCDVQLIIKCKILVDAGELSRSKRKSISRHTVWCRYTHVYIKVQFNMITGWQNISGAIILICLNIVKNTSKNIQNKETIIQMPVQ